ncbi:hypothetical protein WME98_27425 [Sorangium sp. So ce296]|uniref:hypothetical protein n=1 Tax=Sorangium sp. So ce296 TaxID=3133296 RepID=UPI003F63C7B0
MGDGSGALGRLARGVRHWAGSGRPLRLVGGGTSGQGRPPERGGGRWPGVPRWMAMANGGGALEADGDARDP